MKTILLVLSAFVFFAACNSDTKVSQKEESANDAKVKSMATPVDPVTQKTAELKNLDPIGLDELSAWLPSHLNGIKRSNLTMSSDMGYAVAHGDYEKNSKTDMRVTVYDCAGVAGADMYRTAYANKLKVLGENEEGYTKTVDFMGSKAIEHHEKKNKVTTFTFLTDNRILVVVSARNFEPEKVREAAQNISNKL
ncbi:MAG TPA: hypothetical protein VFS22_07825 [Flavisolibacter sp.]|nr:hypothetical protein [Flavisolibacter sp.]